VFDALRRYRQKRVLRTAALPDPLWRDACAALPFLAQYDAKELARLRDLVVLFLDAKSIVGAQGHDVTPLQRTIIAIQACVLVLELDIALFDGFENVVVYPGEFVPGWEYEDEYGVVHRQDDALAGEAMRGGPVILSWPDVAASADWDESQMNLVIHEFAHKIDMRRGEADGCPPLPAGMSQDAWNEALTSAYEDFCGRVDRRESTDIDAYAAESPAEFFAVLSEVFFADPLLFRREYRRLYEQFSAFYRQDPAARIPARG
jgi:Mlc titration factor MtfA (ptsG expression regulator)